MFARFGKLFLGLVAVVIIYASGFYAGQQTVPSVSEVQGVSNKQMQISNVDFSIFWDAWRVLEQKFVGRQDLNRQKMVYGAVEGMVASLGDPYTAFFSPEQSKLLEGDINGQFGGIGAEIGFQKGVLSIIAPLKDSPAEKAGLLAGDNILKIDASSTADMTLEEAVAAIRGDTGTPITLTIFRNEFDEGKDFTITRDTIQVPVLDWKNEGNGIAYIHLYNFVGNIDMEFQKAAREILASGAKRIVLDLRNNPGGLRDSAVEVASYFIPRGNVILIEDFGTGERQEFRSNGYPYFENMPVVILIDGGSASASEIVAGALKDQRNATLVGAKSFGKGSVQEVTDLPDNALLKITIAKWLTPSGRSIQDQGIEPDITTDMTQTDKDAGKDPQLDKALEIIKQIK